MFEAMHDIMGRNTEPMVTVAEVERQAEEAFRRLDIHDHGRVSFHDFKVKDHLVCTRKASMLCRKPWDSSQS